MDRVADGDMDASITQTCTYEPAHPPAYLTDDTEMDRQEDGRMTDGRGRGLVLSYAGCQLLRAGAAGLENRHLATSDWIRRSLMDVKSRGTF